MPLLDIDISINGSVLPDDVVAFLREADLRVSQFVRNSPVRVTGFVPSDFVTVYHSLRAITEANLASGTSLCEWGSGFGVVASLAAMLEFKVCGIEIERGLVNASRSDLTPNYVPALMRGSRVKGPLLFWSEGVARTEEQQRAANSAGVW